MKARRKSAGLVNPENLSYTGSVPLLLEPDSTHRLLILSRRHMGPTPTILCETHRRDGTRTGPNFLRFPSAKCSGVLAVALAHALDNRAG